MRRAGRNRGFGDSREVRNSERRIVVEVIRLDEALKQIPTHLGRLIGACGGGRGLERPYGGGSRKGALCNGAGSAGVRKRTRTLGIESRPRMASPDRADIRFVVVSACMCASDGGWMHPCIA